VTILERTSALGSRLQPWAPLVLRLAVGLVFLHHGMMKLHTGVGGVAGFLGGLGFPLPTLWAVALIAIETVGAACVLLGVLTRLWAAAMAAEMVVAIAVAVVPNGRSPELEGLLLAGALALAGLGDGPLALGRLFRRGTA
jgi:putative oxidoreductase